ncbi:ParB/RepB/Spo0J family partition protein [Novosphingobium sp. P6W]|uniref:ParB/RepB/Spo0J family partition protein n=1 Tax=Novosphingobium sp. P6W TaxID=1609758 RepID=UPI0005C2C922|nr:ParB/RepB/Spo0J family partition protein [Novosphingobium sp. P6W]AXB75175.1 ParB/RepB/Spo0J family partition protein [Novosphingobium sp. P6W]KIS32767.1 chromosome partitioning protein ParB [Novosphingobium sp. P6W]
MNDDPIIRFSLPGNAAAASAAGGPTKQKPKGLGRGLGALLGETRREEPVAGNGGGEGRAPLRVGGLAVLSIADITPDPQQPRRIFDEAALEELAASIAQRGVIQPIIVRPRDNGRYQLVAGERRWRAAQKAQLHEIPALVRELTDREVMALALIENLQREDLNPIEEARAYNRLSELEGMTQAEIARMVDKSRSHVANFQRLLALPEGVITLVEKNQLSMGHARALIGCDDAEDIAEAAVTKQMSVREIEKLVRKKQRGDTAPRRARAARNATADADIMAVQNHLEEFLGLPVKISADVDPASGTVTIRYSTLDQLDLVCQRLTGGAI